MVKTPIKSAVPVVAVGGVAAALAAAGRPAAAGCWLFGLAVGYVTQRSRLCFAGAIRDAWVWRLPSLPRAVAVLLGVSLVGVGAVQYLTGAPGNVFPLGWHTVAGGLLFGLGMGLAGACALTTLVRLGEGALVYALAVAGLAAGGLVGLRVRAWWGVHVGQGQVVFLPSVLGWPLAVLAGLVAIAAVGLAVGAACRRQVAGRARMGGSYGNPLSGSDG